jgi:hypothetical protein
MKVLPGWVDPFTKAIVIEGQLDPVIDYTFTIVSSDWVNGVQGKNAIVEYANNHFYTGEYKNARRHGSGYMSRGQTVVFRGEWNNDRMHGKGQILHGKEMHDGVWENGVLIPYFLFFKKD